MYIIYGNICVLYRDIYIYIIYIYIYIEWDVCNIDINIVTTLDLYRKIKYYVEIYKH